MCVCISIYIDHNIGPKEKFSQINTKAKQKCVGHTTPIQFKGDRYKYEKHKLNIWKLIIITIIYNSFI